MAFGVTDEGFTRKLREDILSAIAQAQKATVSKFLLTDDEKSVIGNLNAPVVDELAIAWEALEAAYHGFDPDNATGFLLKALAALTGVDAQGPTKGSVTATVNLDASQSFAPGEMVAHVAGDPDNRWTNKNTVTSVSAGNYQAVFESEEPGSEAVAPSGTLTVIAQPLAGWNSITNAADATPGQDEDTTEELRQKRDASLAAQGARTLAAIKAEVIAVDGVEQVSVRENPTDDVDPTTGLPPHSINVLIWDGSPTQGDNNEISQAIYDKRGGGVFTEGITWGASVVDVNDVTASGNVHNARFTRVTGKEIYIDLTYTGSASEAEIEAALFGVTPNDDGVYAIGQDVSYDKLRCAVVALDNIDSVTEFYIGFSDDPTGTVNLAIGETEVALLDTGRIDVTQGGS